MEVPVCKKRPRTLQEKQPFLLGYSLCISVFSPSMTAFQLCKVYKKAVSPLRLARMSAAILPHQTLMKLVQMNIATPVKEHLNPWAAFAVVGVLQGAVYGQCNVHFARALKLSSNASMQGIFRGVGFAALRDGISQGMPFVCSPLTERHLVRPLSAALGFGDHGAGGDTVTKAVSVVGTSVVATVLSQGLHNAQIKMQADQSLTHRGAALTLWAEHGASIFYKGASARIGLLLIVNGLNELLLKKAWEHVDDPEQAY